MIIKEFEQNPNEYQILTIEEIKEKLNELDITSICLTEKGYINLQDKVITSVYTDREHPIVFKKDSYFNSLMINPEWYIENKEEANELIRYICKNTDRNDFFIRDSILIDDKLIESICQNESLKEISLAEFDEKTKYLLSQKHYDMLKKSKIEKVETSGVEKELEENFDPIIEYNQRNLISYYKYQELHDVKEKPIVIHETLTQEELKNFRYLNPNNTIEFWDDSYLDINIVIDRLKELGLENKIVIDFEKKEVFNEFLLSHSITWNNIYIKSDGMEITLKDYLRFEKQLYEMIEPAKNLSSFEKYIYAYNVVKKFKKYKENDEDKMAARNLYRILENKYMVCVGFANMFGDLLNKLGIPNKDLSVSVDTSYDNAYKGEEDVEGIEKSVEKGGHARRYVYIKDEKYGVDGFYITDPTWDNDLEQDLYNHMVLTSEEVTNARRYIWSNKNNSSELLNVNNIEEFYKKINFLLDRKGTSFYAHNTIKDVMIDLINIELLPLDKTFIEMLKNKYSFIGEYSWPEDVSDLIYDLGEYIVSHVNKEISGSTIIEAVSNVYKEAYGFDEEEMKVILPKIIEENKNRQEKVFPKRYRIDEFGNKEVIMNENNKFDIEVESKTM